MFKQLFTLLFVFIAADAMAQTTLPQYADTFQFKSKSGKTQVVFRLPSDTVPGFLINDGNGRLKFQRALQRIDDTSYLIGADTLHISKAGSTIIGDSNRIYLATKDSVYFASLEINRNPDYGNAFIQQRAQNSSLDGNASSQSVININTYEANMGSWQYDNNTSMYETANVGVSPWSGIDLYATQGIRLQSESNTYDINGVNYHFPSSNAIGYLKNDGDGNLVWVPAEQTTLPTSFLIDSLTSRNGQFWFDSVRVKLVRNADVSNPLRGTIAIGDSSLMSNTAPYTVSIGPWALANNTTGSSNMAVGMGALYKNTTGSENMAIGYKALNNNTTANGNVGIGAFAADSLTTGAYNVGIGGYTLHRDYTGAYNIAIGYAALAWNKNVSYNTAIGCSALRNNLSGDQNTAIGYGAMFTSTVGTRNLAIGSSAMYYADSSDRNVAIGIGALRRLKGDNNVAIGYNSLQIDTLAYNSVAIGDSTGWNLKKGNSNVFIGHAVAKNADNVYSQLWIDNSATNTPLIKGDFASKWLAINGALKTAPLQSGAITDSLVVYRKTDSSYRMIAVNAIGSTGGSNATGAAGGDLTGTYPNPSVTWANGYTIYDSRYATIASLNNYLLRNGTNFSVSTTGNVTASGSITAGNTIFTKAGTTTIAPINIPAGDLKTIPESGDFESDGYDLYYTNSSGIRNKITGVASAPSEGGSTPTDAAGGDLTGAYPNPSVKWSNGYGTYDNRYLKNVAGATITGTIGNTNPQWGMRIAPTIAQSDINGYMGLLISPYEQTVGTAPRWLIDAGLNSAAGGSPATHNFKFRVDNGGNVTNTGNLTTVGTINAGNTINTIAGTTSIAPLNMPTGTLKAIAFNGDIENNGTRLFYTNGSSQRRSLTTLEDANTFTNLNTIQSTIGATQNNAYGLWLNNPIAAANAAQQASPAIRWTANGWTTAAPGANAPISYRAYANGIQNTTANGSFTIDYTLNGGTSYSNALVLNTNGNTAAFGGTVSANQFINGGISTGNSNINSNLYAQAGNAATAITATAGTINLFNSTSTAARVVMRGNGNNAPSANLPYANLILGTHNIPTATTGTHPIYTNLAVKPITVTKNAGGLTNNATVYIEGPGAGADNNYALFVDGIGTSKFSGTINAGNYRLSQIQTAPSSATDNGQAGEIRVTADAIYVCTATNNWVKSPLISFDALVSSSPTGAAGGDLYGSYPNPLVDWSHALPSFDARYQMKGAYIMRSDISAATGKPVTYNSSNGVIDFDTTNWHSWNYILANFPAPQAAPDASKADQVGNEDIEITDYTKGIILRTSDGTRARVTLVKQASTPTMTLLSNTSSSTRTEVISIGSEVAAGDVFNLMVYSHTVSITAVSGDNATTIASKLSTAVNNTTAAQWDDHDSAPAVGTAGFEPTATSSSNQITVTLNVQNQLAYWTTAGAATLSLKLTELTSGGLQ